MASFGEERLLAHGAFLRRLALSLLDEASADDVVQETWLAAIERGPREAVSLRAWLAAVTRNAARKLASRERSREQRERRSAHAEAVPAAADVAATLAEQRRVVDAVRDLAEPYRSAILLRFFDDLPPREIASRLDVPVETVKSRIKRGLAELRARLDADHGGDRRTWALALVPLTARKIARPAGAGLFAGALAMTLKTKLAVGGALALVAAVGWLAWTCGGRDGRIASPVVALAPQPTLEARATLPGGSASVASDDEAPPQSPTPTETTPASRGAMVRVLVRTAAGDPAKHARVQLVRHGVLDAGGRQSVVDAEIGTSNVDASCTTSFHELPEGRYSVVASGEDWAKGSTDLSIDEPRQSVAVEVSLGWTARIRGRCEDEAGRPLSGVALSVRQDLGGDTQWSDGVDSFIDGTFDIRRAAFTADSTYTLRAQHAGYSDTLDVAVTLDDERCADAGCLRFENRRAEIVGLVTDPAGQPQRGLFVRSTPALGGVPDRSSAKVAATDADGRFSLIAPWVGRFGLEAEGMCLAGPGTRVTIAESDRRVDVGTLVAETPPFAFRGVCVDENGVPLSGAEVSFSVSARTGTDPDGRFVLPSCEPGPATLRALWRGRPGNQDYHHGAVDGALASDESRLVLRRTGVWFAFEEEETGARIRATWIAINAQGPREDWSGSERRQVTNPGCHPFENANVPGHWTFLVTAQGYEPMQVVDDVPEGIDREAHFVRVKLRPLP